MKTLGASILSRMLAVCALLAVAATVHAQGLDENLPPYHPAEGLSGEINLIGSTTIANLADVWRDSFLQYHPKVKINIDVKGSINAVPAVMSGEATFGLLSRQITAQEVEAFQKKFSYPPKILTPSQELMAIFVHKDNPIKGITLDQVAELFSADDKRPTWGDLGLTGAWTTQPVVLHGRPEATGSSMYLQQVILRGQPFDGTLQEHKSNMELVDAIGASRNAIGYAGLIYQSANVKAVPLAVRSGQPFVDVNSTDAALGRYPLMRPLQLVVNQAPGQELPAVQQEFLRYVFSSLGQEDVVKGGFQPVPGPNARIALDQIGLRELK